MKLLRLAFLIVALTVSRAFVAQGEVATINILSPADHAQLDAGEEHLLVYEVIPGPGGDHFHVWVDQKRGPGVHNTAGTYALPKLGPGEHLISIKVVDKGHIPTGPQGSITVIAR